MQNRFNFIVVCFFLLLLLLVYIMKLFHCCCRSCCPLRIRFTKFKTFENISPCNDFYPHIACLVVLLFLTLGVSPRGCCQLLINFPTKRATTGPLPKVECVVATRGRRHKQEEHCKNTPVRVLQCNCFVFLRVRNGFVIWFANFIYPKLHKFIFLQITCA